MVYFARRRFGRRQRLTVRTAPALHGHRVVVRHPDGRRVVYDFPDYSARYLGTVAIQADLLRDGWRPVRPPRRPTAGAGGGQPAGGTRTPGSARSERPGLR